MAKKRSTLLHAMIAVFALVALESKSWAQLDSSCTVSALNRTAPVQEDGAWVLPNVPANVGQVRVRATCVDNGVVRSGASSLVTVPANGIIKVDDIVFQGPPPVPSSLTVSSPQTSLTAVGQTVQLSSVATYPGGSTTDVTAAEKGTDYRSSNPAIASVDANGMVTAHASGVALVSAVNEGALGVLRIQVIASGDSDGDGLPDDWELAHGLDPNNPVDALDDQDGDGLSTITEYLAGLDPFNPDTDGDGLADGREVNELGTNPLLVDSDGDGLRDGLEVQTGSDPLDANSFNLAAALASLEVTPGSFRLLFNTVFGEASRQLSVNGRLIDGFSLDITAHRYGTTYGSSDLTIAGFGPEDGRIYAGQDGQAVISVNNHGFSANALVTVETFSPQALSFVEVPGFANNVAVSGDYAFVAAGAMGLQVVDVTNPVAPFLAGGVDTPGNANDVRIVGDYAFVADGWSGVAVIDVSRPTLPRLVAEESVAGAATDLVVKEGRAYVADEQGLSLVDVSEPGHPVFLAAIGLPDRARGVDVNGNLAVVAASGAGVQIVDVSDPDHLAVVGETATRPDGTSNAADVVVQDRLAYVADGAERALGGMRVIDFRDPTTPVVIGSSTDLVAANGPALEGGLLWSSDYYYVNAVPVFSADPGSVQLRSVLDFSGPPSFRDDDGHGIAVRNGLVYLAAGGGQQDNGTYGDGGHGGLHIGRYALLDEDQIPPTIRLTPLGETGARPARTRLLLQAEARDDVRVASVQFLVNGEVVSTDFAAPYESSYDVPADASTLRIDAIATDSGGNQTAAMEQSVEVAANTAPEVALLAPVPGQTAVEGSRLTIAASASDDHGVTRVAFAVNGIGVRTMTAPPYRFAFVVPQGVSQLAVMATAFDELGPSTPSGPVVVPVVADQPPLAVVLAPRDGSQVTEQSDVLIVAGAADDAGVQDVNLLVDGNSIGTLINPPYEWVASAPEAGGTMRIGVVVTDSQGHQTASPEIVVTAVPDPGMALRGSTVDEGGIAVAGARIEAAGLFTLSGPDGSFELAGLPTNEGFLNVNASAVRNGFALSGSPPQPVPPAPGNVVDVGTIVLTADDPGTTVIGQTVDEDGSPVAGATVKLFNDSLVLTTLSHADGGFSLAGAPTRDSLSLRASAEVGGVRLRGQAGVYGNSEVTDVGAIILQPVEEVPDPLTAAVGNVTDSGGNPVAGARVHVSTSFDVFQTLTGPDGTFSLSGLPTVDGDLEATASAVLDGELNVGSAFPLPPEPEGTTDFGTIEISTRGGGGVRLTLPDFLVPQAASVDAWLREPICPEGAFKESSR